MVEDETSAGTLLGGRLAYRQLRAGHRSGFEPVLMAAFCPARPGVRVLELGTGAGRRCCACAPGWAGSPVSGLSVTPPSPPWPRRISPAMAFTISLACRRMPPACPSQARHSSM
ncbi:hypothetical protein GT370_11530 [Acidocella sp. MX-AZ03]|uniref:hypothetical protein n=1 Tax=Acidocella sp. MX-AZ03 TaxID=2697363 RepID=UPI0022DD7D21|nr:hypothetical protein [Acidocella sp. MX-AZ03]WBO57919.1 hypothetical protein GT370_11530 [Acidocella sp. MX-AZ03]